MSRTNRETTHPYNSRIIQIYLKLFERNYPSVDVAEILDYAGMKSHDVQDESYWFTQEQVDRFYDKTVQLTGNPNIAREAGRYSTSVETHSIFRRYFLGFLGPARAYQMLSKASEFITRGTDFTIKKRASNSVEIIATPCPGIHERPYQCENRTGIMEAIALTFTNKLPRVVHRECVVNGDPACRYIISWEESFTIPFRRFRYALISSVVLANLILLPIMNSQAWSLFLLLTMLFSTSLSLFAKMKENKDLRRILEELRQSSEELLVQTKMVHRNSALSHEVGQAISSFSDIDQVLDQVSRIFNNLLDYDRGMILLAEKDRSGLIFRSGFGIEGKHLDILENACFHLNKKSSRGIFVVSFREKTAVSGEFA